MGFNTKIVTIGSDATSILSANTNQKKRVLKNNGSHTLYLGSDSSITSSIGFPVAPGEEFAFNDYNGVLYGILNVTNSDTVNVQVLEDE